MKHALLTCTLVIMLIACHKTTVGAVYDSHLFAQLQAHSWIFDSASVTDSLNQPTTVYASDTAQQVTSFSSQIYNISTIRDTVVLNTINFQATFNNPDQIYYYGIGNQLLPDQYLIIDTVNEQQLVLRDIDTLSVHPSLRFYHAQ